MFLPFKYLHVNFIIKKYYFYKIKVRIFLSNWELKKKERQKTLN